ncbi:MAG TPA: thioredoxin family protein [Verrucomicrobiae bacterium]|jgi:thioredoxin-related protein
MKIQHITLLLFFVGCSITGAQTNSATNGALDTTRANLYDESADGSKQIADALGTATKEHKRVILIFGANDCGWCHKLHSFFLADKSIAAVLHHDFVVVLIDVKVDTSGEIENWHNGHLLKKYSPVYQGVPFIVVLDSDGKQVTTQDTGNTGKLEEGDHYSHDKALAFLKEWAPKV